ncbi:MAG: hypothetical protein ABEN55_13180, partial [Bradymonadaceae bacterium]
MASIRDGLLGMAGVASPLLVGSVHTGVAAGLAALLLATWTLGEWPGAVDGGEGRVWSVPSLAFWLLVLVCLVQLVPLPAMLHGIVNSSAGEMFAGGRQALFGEPAVAESWRFLSLDPGRTFDRGVRWLVLAVGAGLGAERARRTDDWSPICRMVLAAGLVVTAVGAVQTWMGSGAVLFVYEPSVELPG